MKTTSQFNAQQISNSRSDTNSQNIGAQGQNAAISGGNNANQQIQQKSQYLNTHNQQNFQNNPPTNRSASNTTQVDNQISFNNNNMQQNNNLNSPMNGVTSSQSNQLNNTTQFIQNNYNNGIENQSSMNINTQRNKDREKSDAISSDLNRLMMERMKLRSEVVHYLAKFQYNQAMISASNLCSTSEQIYEKQKKQNEFYELLADQLLDVKILIKVKTNNENKQAITKLKDIFNKIKTRMDDNALKTLHDQTQFCNDPNKSKNEIEIKNQIMSEIRKRCNLISLVANLFYSLGNHKDCEEAYVKYVQLIENVFGQDALETSNCYFLMGVYYLQHRYYVKSLACFKRSMSIRQQKLTEKHESVTDCMYNIGIAYKQMGKKQKSYDYLEKTLYFRRQIIGESSLPVAQTLEILGKVYIEVSDFKIALNKFQECYSIRKSIIQNNKHPDVLRISLLIVHLYNLIRQQISNQESTQSKQAQAFKELEMEMQKTTIDSNIQNHLQLQKNQPERFLELQNQCGIQNIDIQNGSNISASQGYNKTNMMMSSQNVISDNNGEDGKSSQISQNMNQSSIQGGINSGLQSTLPNNSNLSVTNKFKDFHPRASVYKDRTGSFQSKDSSSPHKNTLDSDDMNTNSRKNNRKNLDKYSNKRVKEEISEDEEYSEGEDRDRGQNKYFVNVKGSLLTRMTHQQMNELIKLNEQINEERKKDPLFNPRSMIINSLFIQSIKEMNFKEICQDLIDMNPEIFKVEDFDDLKYLGGGQANANQNLSASPFEKRFQQQNPYTQQYQPQQTYSFSQQNTFNSQNSFSNNQFLKNNNYDEAVNFQFPPPQQNQRKPDNYNYYQRNQEQRTEMMHDPNLISTFLANAGGGNQMENIFGLDNDEQINSNTFSNEQNHQQRYQNMDNTSKFGKSQREETQVKPKVNIQERSNFHEMQEKIKNIDFSKMQNGNIQN